MFKLVPPFVSPLLLAFALLAGRGASAAPASPIAASSAPRTAFGDRWLYASQNLYVDENVRTGVVSVTHARGINSPGLLTSSHIDVDPLTTMPRASGLPVTLRTAAN